MQVSLILFSEFLTSQVKGLEYEEKKLFDTTFHTKHAKDLKNMPHDSIML